MILSNGAHLNPLLKGEEDKIPLLLACPVKFEEYFTGVGEGVRG